MKTLKRMAVGGENKGQRSGQSADGNDSSEKSDDDPFSTLLEKEPAPSSSLEPKEVARLSRQIKPLKGDGPRVPQEQ